MAERGLRGLVAQLSVRGRTSRIGFWRAWLAQTLLAAAIFAVGVLVAMAAGWWAAPVFALFPVIYWMSLATAIRRLHDRGKSAWWWLLFFGPAIAAALLAASIAVGAAGVLVLAALPLYAWGAIEIGFIRGQRGENRFGSEPA